MRDQLSGSDQLDSESSSINCAIICKYIFIDRQHCCTECATEDITQMMALTHLYYINLANRIWLQVMYTFIYRKRCMICSVASSLYHYIFIYNLRMFTGRSLRKSNKNSMFLFFFFWMRGYPYSH